jgi:hypothetical protein
LTDAYWLKGTVNRDEIRNVETFYICRSLKSAKGFGLNVGGFWNLSASRELRGWTFAQAGGALLVCKLAAK